ncbi:hypothetical protein [Leucobacter sp. M11]|uniref:hypothetical protein n=1 Tax=Leucobacter sp. M11 TaxID=2993565 RepID=UPI002D80B0A5|nr:hypothetical protein [Leucobacter sp. M11]MEB4615348.1 hypothetical protein [Leucobacter sp. M11]
MTISHPAEPDTARVITGLRRELERLRTGRRREVTILALSLLGIIVLGLFVLGQPGFGPAALLVLGVLLVTELVLLETRVLRANRRIAEKQRVLDDVTAQAPGSAPHRP